MKILEFTILIFTFSCRCYEKRCPYYSEWGLYSRAFCRGFSYSNYNCLFDTNDRKYVESCNEDPDYVSAGYKYVISGRRRDLMCSREMYQPFIFWSNVSSDCVFKKSTFNEIGQVIYNNGGNKEDRKLRCDFSKGHAFVEPPVSRCFCTPSIEDCTCYQKKCTNGTKLSSDYNCVGDDNGWSCPRILSKETTKKDLQPAFGIDPFHEDGELSHDLHGFAAVFMVIVISFFLVLLVLLYVCLPRSIFYNKVHISHDGTSKQFEKPIAFKFEPQKIDYDDNDIPRKDVTDYTWAASDYDNDEIEFWRLDHISLSRFDTILLYSQIEC